MSLQYPLICFDAGFTLIHPRQPMAAMVRAVLAEEGLSASEADLERAWQAAEAWFYAEYHRPDNDTWGDDRRIHATWRQYHTVLLEELTLNDPAGTRVERLIAAHNHFNNWQSYPDVRPTLEHLRERGHTLAVISDWHSGLVDLLTSLELHEYFAFFIVSGAHGMAKPHPAFYRCALEQAQIAPEAALMIGDNYKADVEAAQRVGMTGLWLDRLGQATFTGPTLRSLTELPVWLSKDPT